MIVVIITCDALILRGVIECRFTQLMSGSMKDNILQIIEMKLFSTIFRKMDKSRIDIFITT